MTTPPVERPASLTSARSDWAGLRVAVLGCGVTGYAAADSLIQLGANVLVVAEAVDERRARLVRLDGRGELVVAPLSAPPARLVEFEPELVIVSPGFRPDHPVVDWARAQGIAVWGDVELAWRLRDRSGTVADWIAVTGTNGKTTTVEMTTAMLAAAGLRVRACGNIGDPVLDAVWDPQGYDVLVVELSSFQLHWLAASGSATVAPYSSACVNIADDHLDWHGSFAAYRDAKAGVYERTRVACVYNRADAQTERMVREADVVEGARAIGFGLDAPGIGDVGLVDGVLCDRAFVADRAVTALEVCTLDELRTLGLGAPHIVQNVLAATALARSYGIEMSAVRDGLQAFRLDPHRIEPVATIGGVVWIDDSKATNPHAASASLRAFDGVVWIVGGLLKGVDIDALVEREAHRLHAAVVIGRDRSAVRDAFARHAPALPVREVDADETGDVMDEAVAAAAALARTGDTVLLAPAAASMDQFTDYAQRGRLFAEAVRRRAGGAQDDESTA